MFSTRAKAHNFSALIVAAFLALSGCATPIDTYSDHDASVDFANYKTFTWISDHPMVASPSGAAVSNPFMESRIQEAIRSELTMRGYRLVGNAKDADFVVSFSVGGRKELSVESYPIAYRGRWAWGSAYVGDSMSVDSSTEGVLAIDVFDARSKSPIWHGVAKKNLTEAEENLRGSIIQDSVAAILGEFPPSR
ncbi:MAG: DUF4136 domain-containing protein [Woeseiaceae bacterium]|nr:DUF4136 domain-containing protein [Woeseiaceae bacterium]